MRMIRNAFAKLNLSLAVGPPEPPGSPKPGFHRIVSHMHAVDLADEVRLEHQNGGTSSHAVRWAEGAVFSTAIDWPVETDLAVRAHRLLEERVGRSLPVTLELVKRIPVGGGLGGGSTDAAATLLGLIELFELSVADDVVLGIAMELGSDVAFFCDRMAGVGPPRPAVVTGFGEGVRRVPSERGDVVLIVPPFGCETKAVYRAFDRRAQFVGLSDYVAAAPERNDLAVAAIEAQPRLRDVWDAAAGAVPEAAVRMSGSGSTLFVRTEPGAGGGVAARLGNVTALSGCAIVTSRLVG